ncbi:MAG: hypothetical protein HY822_18225 [Acidobacteria bacterium]|nr:hypothetical protein [Acidobacteriota bacterium]
MQRAGAMQAGNSLVIVRLQLLDWLRRLAGGRRAEIEQEGYRVARLSSLLEAERQLLPGRKVEIRVAPTVLREAGFATLPGTIHLGPGKLEIEFFGTEDLAHQLVELSQAMLRDYAQFAAVCEELTFATPSVLDRQ